MMNMSGRQENNEFSVILITLDCVGSKVLVENLAFLPHISELKNKGVFFENAFSVGPSTVFSFPAIIGGIFPYHFGFRFPRGVETIDTVLKEHGYNTALINEANALLTPFFGYGKNIDYQNHFLSLSHAAVDRRLEDTFLKGRDEQKAKQHLKQRYLINKLYQNLDIKWIRAIGRYLFGLGRFIKLYLTRNTENFDERMKLHNEFRHEILSFIAERFCSPQFLWIHSMSNHLPYLPRGDRETLNTREIDYLNYRALSRLGINSSFADKLKILYLEALKRNDELIGDIISALRMNALLDNSILVITADHGEEFVEEGYFGHEPESSSDSSLHVPLLFYSPSLFKNKSISAPVSTIDILPTISDLLGLKIPASNRGISLKGMLLEMSEDSKEEGKLWQRPIFSEAWDREGLLDRNPGTESKRRIFTVRQEQFKLKVVQKQKNENIITEKLDLVNWINNEKLDINSNGLILEQFNHLLHNHINNEGLFARRIRTEAERQQITKALSKIRNKV